MFNFGRLNDFNMKRIVAIRPGVTRNRTAFEAMTLIYTYLEQHYEYNFTIVHSKKENYEHPKLKTVAIPQKAWTPTIPHSPLFLRKNQYRKHIDPLVESADGVLTVDPTIFYQGALVINRAEKCDTPVWYDASKTIADPDPHWYAIRSRLKRAVKQTAGVIATVPKVMERYQDLGLFDAEIANKFTIMGHPVDTDRFTPIDDNHTESLDDSEPIVVLAMTRLVPEKGIYYILEAMTQLLKSGSIKLQFLGEGPLQSIIEREARQRGVENYVEFKDTVPHDEVPAVIRDADIFVNHAVSIDSWEEYFGAANLEAMACGVPTVVSDSGGIPYVIRDSEVVEMVPQRDVADLRQTIDQLVCDPAHRKKLAKAGRKYVESNYSVAELARKYDQMLQQELPE